MSSQSVFGELRLERGAIPEALRDVAAWPTVDASAIPRERRQIFERRCDAVTQYLTAPHVSVAEIVKKACMSRKSLYSVLARCLAQHPDGRLNGFRGALPYRRIRPYTRIAPVRGEYGGLGGAAGALTQLLQQHSQIDCMLRRAFYERNRKLQGPQEVRKSIRSIHRSFLKACRDAGRGPGEYPFTERRLAIRSLYAFFQQLANETFEAAVAHAGGQRARALPKQAFSAPAATRAFEVVEFDGHKIDLRLTVRIRGPSGIDQLVEVHRVWILVLLDVATRCVIGYHIALSREYSQDDVASALQAALTPFKPRRYSIPSLAIREGGGFPSHAVPGAAYACWDWFRCDNAKAHLAADTIERLTTTIGCWTDIGPPAQPNERPHIERFFHLVARHFAHALPGNLGSDPRAIERALSDPGKDIRLLVEIEELNEMIEVLIADYNGEPHPALDGSTPLEAMAYSLGKHGRLVRVLPQAARANLCLLQQARIVTVRGEAEKGLRPHINFFSVRYSNTLLASSPALIGKKLRIYFDVRDIRTVRAFFDDGTELGVLTAARPWSFTPHSLKVRQEICRLVAERKLVIREGDSPTEAWVRHKLAQRDPKRVAGQIAKHQAQERQVVDQVAEEAGAEAGESIVALQAQPAHRAVPPAPGQAPARPTPSEDAPSDVTPQPMQIRKTFTF